MAATRGELPKVVKWLRKGGHVDALFSWEDADGSPFAALLHAAAAKGQLAVAKELLKRGATVDQAQGASRVGNGAQSVVGGLLRRTSRTYSEAMVQHWQPSSLYTNVPSTHRSLSLATAAPHASSERRGLSW